MIDLSVALASCRLALREDEENDEDEEDDGGAVWGESVRALAWALEQAVTGIDSEIPCHELREIKAAVEKELAARGYDTTPEDE
jgi:hypothetical protein